MNRVGQVWSGPRLSSEPSKLLLLVWEMVEAGTEQYMSFNLETGELEDFFTRDLEEDENWERIA